MTPTPGRPGWRALHEQNWDGGRRSAEHAIDTGALFPFDARVVRILLAALCLALAACAGPPPAPYQVENPKPAPDRARPRFRVPQNPAVFSRSHGQTAHRPDRRLRRCSNAAIGCIGAVTALDQHQRFGTYFDVLLAGPARRRRPRAASSIGRKNCMPSSRRARSLSARARHSSDRIRDHRRRFLRRRPGHRLARQPHRGRPDRGREADLISGSETRSGPAVSRSGTPASLVRGVRSRKPFGRGNLIKAVPRSPRRWY